MNEKIQPPETAAETEKDFELLPNLAEQYESQKEMFEKFGILTELSKGEQGIVGIDGQEYPFPSLKQIGERMSKKRERIEKKQEQGFAKLLIVPFGMKLDDLIEVYRLTILKHSKEKNLFSTKQGPKDEFPPEFLEINGFREDKPIMFPDDLKEADQENRLVYFPKELSPKHQGKTKQELLMEDPDNAWQAILIEDMPHIPRRGEGKTVGGRPQIDTVGSSIEEFIREGRVIGPKEFLNALQEKPIYQGEQAMTPEDYLIYAITYLETTNRVLDEIVENIGSISGAFGSRSYLLGAYLLTAEGRKWSPYTSDHHIAGGVLDVGWNRKGGLDSWSWYRLHEGNIGIRTTVRF
ncbi:MAG: hypothetical protein V1845_02295 [bacterium]